MQVEAGTSRSILIPSELTPESVAGFEEGLEAALRSNPRLVVIDSSRLVQVTSNHIKILWQAYRACVDAGVGMKLKSPSPGLIRVLKVLDLYDIVAESHDIPCPRSDDAAWSGSTKSAEVNSSRFAADPVSVDRALEGFLKFVERLHLPETTEFELRTVFYEVATNIRAHAGIGENDPIAVSCRADDSKIVLVFADTGIPFDPTRMAANMDLEAAAREGRARGFGITLIRRLTDNMSYVRKNNKMNILTLEKRRAAKDGQAEHN